MPVVFSMSSSPKVTAVYNSSLPLTVPSTNSMKKPHSTMVGCFGINNKVIS
jgi:hypothetical protein